MLVAAEILASLIRATPEEALVGGPVPALSWCAALLGKVFESARARARTLLRELPAAAAVAIASAPPVPQPLPARDHASAFVFAY